MFSFWLLPLGKVENFFLSSYGLNKIISLLTCKPAIGLMSRVFASGSGDRGSILGRVRPKTPKMVLDAALLNTEYDKVRIKGKVEQSR